MGNGLGEGQPGAAEEQVVQALETTVCGMLWEEWGATGKGEKRNPLLKASFGQFSGCFLKPLVVLTSARCGVAMTK